jgi:hypothetical protein
VKAKLPSIWNGGCASKRFGITRKNLARKRRVADLVAHGGDGTIKVEAALVGRRRALVRELEPHVAQRLVGLVVWALHLLAEFASPLVVAGKDGRTNLRQNLLRPGIVPIARAARPERGLVKLEMFRFDAPEDHRAQTTVADRQGLGPTLGGSGIAQAEGVAGLQPAGGDRQQRRGKNPEDIH